MFLILFFDYLLVISRCWVLRKESKGFDISNLGNLFDSNIICLIY